MLAAALLLAAIAWLGACDQKEEVAATAPPAPTAPPPVAASPPVETGGPPPTAAQLPAAAAQAPRVAADAERAAQAAAKADAAERARAEVERRSASPAPPPPQPAARPSPRTAASPARRCAAADLAPFPWPSPPQPSVTAIVPPYLLFGPESKATTLAAVAARLEGAIARAGYQQPKYLGAGCDGFAIVLDLEHIDTDGARMRGSAGFAPPSQDEMFSLAAYVKRLFYAPPGEYRQIVLVVSEERMAQAIALPTEAQLRAIARDGVSALPTDFSGLPYTSRHVVQALIYEFEKGQRDGDAKLIPPEGRLGATVHLEKARLF
jgi:hypothetical protein